MSAPATHQMAGAQGRGRSIWPPTVAQPLVSFRVLGEPKGAGSKVSGVATRWDKEQGKRVPVINPATGMPKTFTKDSSGAPGTNWRSDVRDAAGKALPEGHALAEGPLAIEIVFYRRRPKGHYGTGRNAGVLKADQPLRPVARPDVLKLARAVEDALTGLVWVDDSQLVEERLSKCWGDPGCEVSVWLLPNVAGAEQFVLSESYHSEDECERNEAVAV